MSGNRYYSRELWENCLKFSCLTDENQKKYPELLSKYNLVIPDKKPYDMELPKHHFYIPDGISKNPNGYRRNYGNIITKFTPVAHLIVKLKLT